jgi:hypothetical protein
VSDNPDAELFAAVMESHLARMSDADWHALTQRVRPPAEPAPALTPEQAMRRNLAEKTAQLQAVPRDHNGPLGGMQAASDAIDQRRGNPHQQPPQSQPEPVAPQQPPGFAPNRAQSAAGGSDWVPINERDLNNQKISDILNRRP